MSMTITTIEEFVKSHRDEDVMVETHDYTYYFGAITGWTGDGGNELYLVPGCGNATVARIPKTAIKAFRLWKYDANSWTEMA